MKLDSFGPLRLWNRIREDWIVTATAARLFFVASILAITITPVILGYVEPNPASKATNLIWGILGAISPFGVFFIWTGMWRYWARVDSSPKWIRRFWFVILLCGLWCGSVLYYLFVYLPQFFRRQQPTAQLATPVSDTPSKRVFGSVLIGGWVLLLVATSAAFVFPRMPGLNFLWPISIFLVISTFVYILVRLFRSGTNRSA